MILCLLVFIVLKKMVRKYLCKHSINYFKKNEKRKDVGFTVKKTMKPTDVYIICTKTLRDSS